jgi:hypothetical protein
LLRLLSLVVVHCLLLNSLLLLNLLYLLLLLNLLWLLLHCGSLYVNR